MYDNGRDTRNTDLYLVELAVLQKSFSRQKCAHGWSIQIIKRNLVMYDFHTPRSEAELCMYILRNEAKLSYV